MPAKRTVKDVGEKAGGAEERPRPRRSAGRPSKLDKVEQRLQETVASIAVMQAGVGVATGEGRHLAGSEVTGTLGPQLVEAWMKLARENPRVEAVLTRMSEGSAWSEVIFVTLGFMYTQAQAYGALSHELVNPWMDPPVPPSLEVVQAATANGEAPGAYGESPYIVDEQGQVSRPIVGRSAEDARSGVEPESADDPAHVRAEAERQRVEARRREQGA